jgi:hypothetical protein
MFMKQALEIFHLGGAASFGIGPDATNVPALASDET